MSLISEARKMASKLLERPAFALTMTKMVINDGINMDFRSAISYEARCFELLFSTEDQKKGMKAFIEKKSSKFRGM